MAVAAPLDFSTATFRLGDRVLRLSHRRDLLAPPPVGFGCRGAGFIEQLAQSFDLVFSGLSDLVGISCLCLRIVPGLRGVSDRSLRLSQIMFGPERVLVVTWLLSLGGF
jgi:hypothetical protein